MRIRVKLDIEKPLARRKTLAISGMEPMWISFTYERLPNYYVCNGILGHGHRECKHYDREIYNQLPYSHWLHASPKRSQGTIPIQNKRTEASSSPSHVEPETTKGSSELLDREATTHAAKARNSKGMEEN